MSERLVKAFEYIESIKVSSDTKAIVEALRYVAMELADLNAGLAMLIENKPGFATQASIDELINSVDGLNDKS
jgi:cob(I)alamin adenosyltransferase